MAFTAATLGDTLVVDLLDGDFAELQDLFRSGLLKADFNTPFSRFLVRRYTAGRLVSATALAGQLLQVETAHLGQLDVLVRYGAAKNSGTAPVLGDGTSRSWDTVAMELLGRPGPSFFYQWQEDGIGVAALAGVSGWPPNYWPITRYPSNLCFSPWLTVPGASLRTWADEPCVARVSGTALGMLNFSPVGLLSAFIPGADYTEYSHSAISGLVHHREAMRYRFALVADTNPRLFTDEFTNDNPNIVDSSGAQAPFRTWKILTEHPYYAMQRESFKLTGEVALKGRRYYNFSMKYRDGGIRGYVYDAMGTATWNPGFWRADAALGRVPILDATYLAQYAAVYPGDPGVQVPNIPYVNLWDGAALHVDFDYGRGTAYITDSAHAEFSTKVP